MEIGLCLEMVWTDAPLAERMARAAAIGFEYVEMWLVGRHFQGAPEDLAAIARRAGVQITGTLIGSSDGSGSAALTSPLERQQWLDQAKAALEFNRRAEIPMAIVCTGNTVGGLTDEQMFASVVEGLKPTVERAERAGVTLLLEPLNTVGDHPGYFLTSSDRGAEICRLLRSDRVKLLFDCYHMQIMEGNLLEQIERNKDVIGHIHAAGVPGRHEPFLGEVNYAFIAQKLRNMGYRGVFALEYTPSMADSESLKQTLAYLT